MTKTIQDVKGKGIMIPEPIVVAFLHMDYENIGEIVRAMALWMSDQKEDVKLAYESNLVLAVWKAMVRQDRGVPQKIEQFNSKEGDDEE